ncbi:hypothetical protein As57867_019532, partial [Aphanomyces stellatus]
MQKHVTDMRGLQRKLLLMGSHVDDDMLGKILLTSVKEAFPTTVEILRSRELSPTLDQITNRLLAKEDEMKSGTTTKRKADDGQLLYTDKPDKNRPFKKQVVKDKCHYCHKVGHHAFECRFKKRDLAKGITRKCIPIEGEDQIYIRQQQRRHREGLRRIEETFRDDRPGTTQVDPRHPRYVEVLLDKFNMVDSNPVSTPEVIGQVLKPSKLNPSQVKALNLPYRELVGSLQYL